MIYKKPNIVASISVSILIILIVNPYKILDAGLQLSYGGTLGIILLNNILEEKVKIPQIKSKLINIIATSIKQMSVVSISANLIIFPIIAFHYNTISLTFFISNILAGPILGIIIILGFITIFISFISIKISKIPAVLLLIFIKTLILIANFTSQLPFSKIYIKTPNIFAIILYYILLFILIYLIKCRKRAYLKTQKEDIEKTIQINNLNTYKAIGQRRYERILIKNLKNKKMQKNIIIILLSIAIILQVIKIVPSNLKIHFIDVGQGDSTLIVTPKHHKILIDGGGSEANKSYDVGKSILIPYLLDRGITKIDYIFVSHFDSDHVDGLLTIMKEIKVKCVIIGKQFGSCDNYEEFIKIVEDKNIKVHIVQAGQTIKIEKNLYFDILWPSSDDVISENSINNNSLVCKLSYQKFTILFTGDIEQIAEKAILEKYKGTNVLQSTILKVAHHGSKSSSTEEFLNLVKPQIALIGVGEDNNFGHPNESVLKRLRDLRL